MQVEIHAVGKQQLLLSHGEGAERVREGAHRQGADDASVDAGG